MMPLTGSQKKRWFAAVLAAVLFLAALPVGVPAEEAGEPVPQGAGGCSLRATVDQLGGGPQGQTSAATFGAPAESLGDASLYSQLTARQKACYDALEAVSIDQILTASRQDGYAQVAVNVPAFYGLTLTGSMVNGSFRPDAASAAREREIYTDLCAAIVALRYDRPDILWMSDMLYGYRWSQVSSSSVRTSTVLFAFKLVYDGREKAMWQDSMAAAQSLADQVDQSADTYTQVKTVYQLLAQDNTYADLDNFPDSWGESLCHMAYSALITWDGYQPVCDGYAKAVKVVCDLLDIPCVLASSNTHMWNNVKMDDGEWYNLDLTWDDGDGDLAYDYFLVGSQTEIWGVAFSQQSDHREVNPFVQTADLNAVTFRFPTKSRTAYQYLGQDYPELTFPDVTRGAWYYDEVERAVELGLFQGDGGLFYPGRNISRAEFCQVAARSQGVDLTPYEGISDFTDVDPGLWYAPAIAWAREAGVMEGNGNGTFRPNDPITRQEMCQVLYNLLGRPGAPSGQEPFPDDGDIANWARDAVYACRSLGLVLGNDDGTFAPASYTQRSQAAAVFVRLADTEAA